MVMTTQQLPLGYRYENGNLYQSGDEQPISNFYIVPSATYCVSAHALPDCADIDVVRNGERIPLAHRMKLVELTTAWWKRPPVGCAYCPSKRGAYRHLQSVFQCLLGELHPVPLFQPTALGWTRLPSGEPVYVTGSGAIGANGFLAANNIEIPEALQKYRLEKANATIGESLDYFWSLFDAMPGITDILLANSLSAILLPFFKAAGVEPRFPLLLEGPSETKKTTLACLTSCLYNRQTGLYSCVATLTSTSRSKSITRAEHRQMRQWSKANVLPRLDSFCTLRSACFYKRCP